MHSRRLQRTVDRLRFYARPCCASHGLLWPVSRTLPAARVRRRSVDGFLPGRLPPFSSQTMYKLFTVLAAVSLTAGCTTYVHRGQHTGISAGSCEVIPSYEVTVDSWCGNGCSNYPVSHKMRHDNRRVELNGTQTAPVCSSK